MLQSYLNKFHAFRNTRQTWSYCEYINTVHPASVYVLVMDVVEPAIPETNTTPRNIATRWLYYSMVVSKFLLTLRQSAGSTGSPIPITNTAIFHQLAVTLLHTYTMLATDSIVTFTHTLTYKKAFHSTHEMRHYTQSVTVAQVSTASYKKRHCLWTGWSWVDCPHRYHGSFLGG